jgi:hypothetical protein
MNSYNYHWIGWEHLQETMVFPMKYRKTIGKTIGKPSENDDLSENNDDLMGF